MIHGQLFRLALQLPKAWDVDLVEMLPPERLASYRVRLERDDSTLLVDLHRPLTAGDKTRSSLSIRLRAKPAANSSERRMTFPDVIPIGGIRDGALAIAFDTHVYEGRISPGLMSVEPPAGENLWATSYPQYFFTFGPKPLEGTLFLNARPPQVAARCTTELFITPGGTAITSRLRVEAESGSPNSVVIESSAFGDTGAWRVESAANSVLRAEPIIRDLASTLQAAFAGSPIDVISSFQARWPRNRMRLTLAKPIHVGEPITLVRSMRLSPKLGFWEIPLITVHNAGRFKGDVTIFLTGTAPRDLEWKGLREVSEGSPGKVPSCAVLPTHPARCS